MNVLRQGLNEFRSQVSNDTRETASRAKQKLDERKQAADLAKAESGGAADQPAKGSDDRTIEAASETAKVEVVVHEVHQMEPVVANAGAAIASIDGCTDSKDAFVASGAGGIGATSSSGSDGRSGNSKRAGKWGIDLGLREGLREMRAQVVGDVKTVAKDVVDHSVPDLGIKKGLNELKAQIKQDVQDGGLSKLSTQVADEMKQVAGEMHEAVDQHTPNIVKELQQGVSEAVEQHKPSLDLGLRQGLSELTAQITGDVQEVAGQHAPKLDLGLRQGLSDLTAQIKGDVQEATAGKSLPTLDLGLQQGLSEFKAQVSDTLGGPSPGPALEVDEDADLASQIISHAQMNNFAEAAAAIEEEEALRVEERRLQAKLDSVKQGRESEKDELESLSQKLDQIMREFTELRDSQDSEVVRAEAEARAEVEEQRIAVRKSIAETQDRLQAAKARCAANTSRLESQRASAQAQLSSAVGTGGLLDPLDDVFYKVSTALVKSRILRRAALFQLVLIYGSTLVWMNRP